MLISKVIEDFAGGGQDAELRSLSVYIGHQFVLPAFMPAPFFDGMCEEVQLLLARMCSPMMAAIQQAQGEPNKVESVTSWMQRALGNCALLDATLSNLVQQLVDEYALAWTRFCSDRAALENSGVIEAGADVLEVRIASADKHHGQHVLELSMRDSPALFYKPRPGSGAMLLRRLSVLLEKWGFALGAAPTLDFGSHHWMAEVPYVSTLSKTQALQYAYNGGVLYGLATLLNASDLHFENIIASSGGPVVVDCETLCQPKFSEAAAAHLLKRPYDEHADGTSLFLNLDIYCNQPIDYGGLSCVDMWIRKDPHAGLQVQLAIDTRKLAKHSSRSAVEVDGVRQAPAVVHFDYFVEGFTAFCSTAATRKHELVELIDQEALFRIPLRATRVYAAMISERLSQIYFSSYANQAWGQHLYAELETVDKGFKATALAILEVERQEIEALDIPVAYVRAGSRNLEIGRAVLAGVFDQSPMEVVQRRLDGVNQKFISDRTTMLRARLAESNAQQIGLT